LFGLCPARRSSFSEGKKKVGTPFKSSLFGKSVGIEAVEKRIEKSAEVIKNKRRKECSKRIIATAMRTANNRPAFEKALEKQGISVVFRENEQGRIYGATFIDHEQKCVFNGSRLGKEFSANVFNDLFSNDGKQSVLDTGAHQSAGIGFFSPPSEGLGEASNSNSGGIFDFFSSAGSAGDDHEEKAFLRRTKKKKKRQRGL
jgi:hypothetical protein